MTTKNRSVSLIICTYSRCESLRRTLETCCDLVIPCGVTWELLVLDNNSTDATKQVCREFIGKLPIRYVFEPRQGKSCALNTALQQAQGELLLFTDDDVRVDQKWMMVLVNAAEQYPDVSIFGGKVIPQWEAKPPKWIQDNCHPFLDYMFVRYGLGHTPRYLSRSDHPFFGANLAIRQHVFRCGVRFDEAIGPQGKEQVHGEETTLQHDLLSAGHKGLYLPDALVYHRNTSERLTERYLRKYCKGIGIREVRLSGEKVEPPYLFGVPRWRWKVLARQCLQYCWCRVAYKPAIWLEAEVQMSITWGRICELRRMISQKGGS